MAQTSNPKNPLDVLQGMIDCILIETGRALRTADREGPRALGNIHTRLRSTIPSAIENFHQALDDIECEIVRAKAVLLRDLEELRAKRIALENPPPKVIEEQIKDEPTADLELTQENSAPENTQPTPQPTVKEEDVASPPAPVPPTLDPPKETITKVSDDSKEAHGPSPSNAKEVNADSNAVDLGINTSIATDPSAPGTAGMESIDSLFDMPDDGNNNDDSALNFDGMDFSIHDSNTEGNSHAQNNDFDLSTFGNNPQDFNMTDPQTSNNTGNSTNPPENKQDDMFGMINNNAGDDMMDLDLNMQSAEESAFDSMFLIGDDGGTSGGGDMDHGAFDNAFFGLDN